jgi:hypothetical protein
MRGLGDDSAVQAAMIGCPNDKVRVEDAVPAVAVDAPDELGVLVAR